MTAADKPTIWCSFCAKRQDETLTIVAGPSVYICDECVDMAVDIVDEQCKRKIRSLHAIREDRASVRRAIAELDAIRAAADRTVNALRERDAALQKLEESGGEQ